MTDLRQLYAEPSSRAKAKTLNKLDRHCRHFISLSPFLVLSSAAADGSADVSPRGDPPGFVKVLDDTTILIPDRPGNNRLDSFSNIVANPHVGLLFMIPGINETLRLNGRAEFCEDPALLASLAVDGKTPKLALKIHVDEVYLHCAKAFIRSKLWDPAAQVPRANFPTLGQIMADQQSLDAEATDKALAVAYRETLY